ncbi:MAG: hypothetical protein IAE90_07530 [Ignavibacteria bacterium]|nr:hypothetical protein [Ignavibacteria bacterium]
MRSFILFFVIVFISIQCNFVLSSDISFYDGLDRLNRVSIGTEVMKNKPDNNSYEYDAYLFYVRRIENRKLNANESPEMMLSTCYAEMRYYKGNFKPVSLSNVTVAGNNLAQVNLYGGIAYTMNEELNVRSCVNVTSPAIVWSIDPATDFSGYSDLSSEIRYFPDQYYISSSTGEAVLGTDMDFIITAEKVSTGNTTTVPPDYVAVWLLGPVADELHNLRNLQPCGRFTGPVTQDKCIGQIEARYFKSVMDGAKITPGTGCALVRSYKFYPKEVKNNVTNQMEKWMFVNVVEAEVPVTFR